MTLSEDSNVVNGAGCLDTFEIAPATPDNPSWMSNSGLEITFTPTLIQHVGNYIIQYYLNETGQGACTFIPIIRELTLSVIKHAPAINYNIPDYSDLRAAVPFEIVFGDYP